MLLTTRNSFWVYKEMLWGCSCSPLFHFHSFFFFFNMYSVLFICWCQHPHTLIEIQLYMNTLSVHLIKIDLTFCWSYLSLMFLYRHCLCQLMKKVMLEFCQQCCEVHYWHPLPLPQHLSEVWVSIWIQVWVQLPVWMQSWSLVSVARKIGYLFFFYLYTTTSQSDSFCCCKACVCPVFFVTLKYAVWCQLQYRKKKHKIWHSDQIYIHSICSQVQQLCGPF